MANLSVASIRERIFNTSRHEENVARPKNAASQNPFAQMNGNLLNADVYVSSTNNHAKKISDKAKAFGKWLNETTAEDVIMSMIDRTPSQKHYAMAPVKSTERTLADLVAVESSRIQAAA